MRHHLVPWIAFLGLVLLGPCAASSCGGGGGGATDAPPSEPPPQPPPPPPPPSEWPPLDALATLRQVRDGQFATSLLCARCHDTSEGAEALRDAQNRAVAPFDLWRGSMMSNASRDPFWRAVLSAEMEDNPTHAEAIGDLCMACHAPMARYQAHLEGLSVAETLLQLDTDRAQLALDGVACTLCHQVTDDAFGDASSFTAGFTVNRDRTVFGTHEAPNPAAMLSFSGYTPAYSPHTHEAALCATCHTVFTETLDGDGMATGQRMPEQTPYLEWRNSIYANDGDVVPPTARVCSDCHMPSADEEGTPIVTRLAHNPSRSDFGPGMAPVRSVFHRHLFVGGNTLVPLILAAASDRLAPNASAQELETKSAVSRDFLQGRTAALTVLTADRQGDTLTFSVRVENLAGHKFPTSYPSRRAWLRVRVRNAAGTLVFASGEHDARGRLLDPTGAVRSSESAGGPVLPHLDTIADAGQVQIYEPVMQAPDGAVTHALLRAAGYRKDNRLLPKGWSTVHADAVRTAPQGAAAGDPDFVAGQDDVHYRLRAPAAAGPYALEVDLLYQVLSARHVEELLQHDTRAMADFRRYWQSVDPAPVLVARATATAP